MSCQQKVQILANELTRRLMNIDKNKNQQAEFNKVVDQMTRELKNSEYSHRTAREIITSGIRCWKVRITRRLNEGQGIYRAASTTLKTRTRKKIMAKENWYKQQQNTNNEKTTKTTNQNGKNKTTKTTKTKQKQQQEQAQNTTTRAVMFIPHTPSSTLAKLLKENEEKLEKLTNTRLKIVERTGTKLVDLIT